MIDLQGVTCRFGSLVAVNNVSLSISAGERVALVGPSGAGKTTLLRVINGMLKPASGCVTVKGYRWGESAALDRQMRSQIGVVYQHFNLVGRLNVARNVQAGRIGTMTAREVLWRFARPDYPAIAAVLGGLDIAEKIRARTERLSGGEQQRVAIARALFQDPEILLADEPIASVDPSLSQRVLDLLGDWAGRKRATLVVSLHQVEFALQNFERIIGIRAASIVFDRAPAMVSDAMLRELYDDENLRTTTR